MAWLGHDKVMRKHLLMRGDDPTRFHTIQVDFCVTFIALKVYLNFMIVQFFLQTGIVLRKIERKKCGEKKNGGQAQGILEPGKEGVRLSLSGKSAQEIDIQNPSRHYPGKKTTSNWRGRT